MKGFVFLWMLKLFVCIVSYAQTADQRSGLVRGRLTDAEGQALNGWEVQFPFQKRMTVTDTAGYFELDQLPYGTHFLRFGNGVWTDSFKVGVRLPVSDLGVVRLSILRLPDTLMETEIPVVMDNESSVSAEDDGFRISEVSSPLASGLTPFHTAATFNLALYRFRPRGQDADALETRVNSVLMQNPESGRADWASWSGLNDMMRNRQSINGLSASSVPGGWAGVSQIDASPMSQRKQSRISYALGNRSFRNRIAATWNSGQLRSGWAFSAAGSGRWAGQGVIPGTFQEGYSVFLGMARRWRNQELSLVGIGAWYERGKSLPVTKEAIEVSGNRWYNPAWGLQQGAIRNSRVGSGFQPLFILQHRLQTKALFWQSSFGFQWGKTGNTGLDYYNGRSPRPDYYRYMPSYFVLNNPNPSDPDPGSKAPFLRQQQILWDEFFAENRANPDSILNEAGVAGRTVSGSRSVTVLFQDVTLVQKLVFHSSLQWNISHSWTIAAGSDVLLQQSEHYRQLIDLLGGDFFLNLNQFAEQHSIPDPKLSQFDLNVPDRAIREGDIYAYHYRVSCRSGKAWLQTQLHGKRFELFVAGQIGYSSFRREGFYRNGLFRDISFAAGPEQSFVTGRFRAGFQWKIDGRNYVFMNAGAGSEAPQFEDVYVSPRMNNLTLPGPKAALVRVFESGYLRRSPKVNLFFAIYRIDRTNRTDIRHFYNDDPAYQGFVNYALQGLGSRSSGVETGILLKPRSSVSITAVVAWGQAFYTQNPDVLVYRDNDTQQHPAPGRVYIRNYFAAVGPQSAAMLGCRYQGRQNWSAGVNLIGLDRNYADFNPDRRTEKAVEGLEPESEQYLRILQQERLPAVVSIDLSAGKSWMLYRLDRRFSRNAFLYLYASLNNLLNAVHVTGGFEQLRYDFKERIPERFPNKYFYGAGRSFNISLSLRF